MTETRLGNVIHVHCDTQVTLWGRILKATNYKPGWWALYFLYCAIPIVLYIWYLVKRFREWSVWRQIGTFTAEHPWMWAVYIIAAGFPILLVIYCCCFASQEKYDLKDEDKQPLEVNEETTPRQQEENENESETKSDNAKADEETEKVNEPETANETEELMESEENDKPAMGGDGPRRRKPNKE